MALRKFIQLHDNKDDPESWCYVADAESDLTNAPTDCQMVFVATPDAGKAQWRIRTSTGYFAEVGVGQ